MSKQLAVTVDGKHKIEKKLFYTSEDLIHRAVKKAFLTVGGVHKLVFPSSVIWKKYSCVVEEIPGGYVEHNSGALPAIGHYCSDGLSITAYDSYELSSEDGYVGIGESTYVTPDGLADMVGKYYIKREVTTSVDRFIVYEVDSYDIAGEDGYGGNISSSSTCHWSGTKVAECEWVDATTDYYQGSEYYGSITVEDGELPCDDEYIELEWGDGCVALIDGTYYYYTKEA